MSNNTSPVMKEPFREAGSFLKKYCFIKFKNCNIFGKDCHDLRLQKQRIELSFFGVGLDFALVDVGKQIRKP